ncbi:hypothetical protein [Streptomyces sp. NPDC051677]|uniref:hypothetical protein n=1 Tax=Streptomyces sp. NPDC051677 TaxID=3365669 RepID=UPI0037D70825
MRTICLSLNTFMHGRMSAAERYATPVEVGDVMVGGTVRGVLESRTPERAVGNLVWPTPAGRQVPWWTPGTAAKRAP